MTATPWDDPELAISDEFYDFKAVGASASGIVKWVGKHTYDDGKVVPSLILVDDESGEDRTLNAGQVRLRHLLLEKRPMPGNHLKVVYTNDENRGAGKTMKHFSVDVTIGGGAPAAAPVAAAPAPVVATPAPEPVVAAAPAPAVTTAGVVDPAAAQAAIEAMDPETRKLLGLGV